MKILNLVYPEKSDIKYKISKFPDGSRGIPWIELREIFKDPITDDGTKKSARGLLAVFPNSIRDGSGKVDKNKPLYLKQSCTWKEEQSGLLTTVFKDGKLIKQTTLEEIRERLKK